ncbi:MAG TPA: ATP-binding protein [Gaiellaceae bacterium]|nr:ATP-binding protein [Gaiellaceae bacterium]
MTKEPPHPLHIFMADTQGRIRFRTPLVTYTNAFEPLAHTLWMSPQVETVTGYAAEDWVDRPGFFEEILHPDDRAPVLEEMRRSRAQRGPFSRDYRLRAKDGSDLWIHDESVPVLDAEGEPEFIQGYFVDITERKQLEEALRHAQKTEALGRLAAGIAHDFNNLLTAMHGSAELAERTLDEGHPARRYVVEIAQTVRRAVRLTRQLLAFSRRQELAPQRLDLAALVQEIESMLLHVAGDGVQMDFDLTGSATVCADPGQLEQVMMNLVANARDALEGQGGRISISIDRIDVPRGPESERLGVAPGAYGVLAVADNGVGMPAETLAKLFDPFFTTKERGSGTGLGLSTVHGIVTQSGGTVDVSSVPGEGSTFRVLLPVATLR